MPAAASRSATDTTASDAWAMGMRGSTPRSNTCLASLTTLSTSHLHKYILSPAISSHSVDAADNGASGRLLSLWAGLHTGLINNPYLGGSLSAPRKMAMSASFKSFPWWVRGWLVGPSHHA